MRNQDSLFQKMKKKPALQAIIDNIDNYTVEELLAVKGQPQWIRQQLVKMKAPGPSMDNIEKIADMMMVEPQPPKEYEVRKWNGGTWFMPSGISGKMKVEITPGDCFLILEPGRAKIQSAISRMTQTDWAYFLQNTQYIDNMTTNDFIRFSNTQATSKHSIAKPIAHNEEDRGLFRIIRHT